MTAAALQLVPRRKVHPEYQSTFRFIRCSDSAILKSIMTVPAVYRAISEETTGPASHFEPPIHPDLWHFLVYDNEELIGCYSLFPENSVCWSLHVSLLPLASWVRGRPLASMKALFERVWQVTPCMRIVGKVPDYNRLALQLARKAGMISYGENVMSFPNHGRLYNEILLGISRSGVK